MATIRTAIELEDRFSGVLNNIVNAVNMSVSVMEQMQTAMSRPVDSSALDGVRNYADQATGAVQELNDALQGVQPATPTPGQPEPVEIPVHRQSDTMDMFTNSGVERFEHEVRSANNMLDTLNQTQTRIAEAAAQTGIFSPNAVTDMNGMQDRLQAVRQRIQAIENDPLNMGSDIVNAELEQLRGQLDQAAREQEMLNRAVENMNVGAANQAYLRFSQTVGNTERYIRDNVDKQGRFNNVIQKGIDNAGRLKSMITGAVGTFVGAAGIKKAFGFSEDRTQVFDTQLSAETQLIGVLADTFDADCVSQLELETTADTAGAFNEISAVQNGVDEVVVPVSAESRALVAAFDQITEKASEIQSRGIYGDEAMIAAGTEFVTYFGDTDAIEMMMDTLADYAMGMSGGGEIGSQEMVNYATNLGKLMSGSYDAMTKKGFELSDTQKAIIEGMAAQVAALGEEYADMSGDMQAAAAISQVVEESWSGLYESMSNTPESKIIQLNNAWGDMKENIGGQLYPALVNIIEIIESNWGNIEIIIQGIINGLNFIINVLDAIIGAAAGVAELFIDNRSTIGAIITPIAVALGILTAAMLAYKIAAGIAAVIQNTYNSALQACPLVWFIILIISVIAIIYNVCEAIAKLTGIANSGFGVICGGVNVVIRFFENLGLSAAIIAVGIWNAMCACANDIGAAFNNALVFVQTAFWTFADVIMQGLKSLAEFANNCLGWLGVNIDTSGFDFAKDKISELNEQYREFEDPAAAFNEGAVTFDTFRDGWLEDAFNSGAAWGDGVVDDIGSMLDGFGFGDLPDIPSPEDYENSLTAGGIGSGIEDIAGNTGDIKDSLEITEEDLKYLRDIAEQETVNRFTTAEITIEQTNHNTVSGKMDIDGLVDGLTDKMSEAMFIMAEGVHV